MARSHIAASATKTGTSLVILILFGLWIPPVLADPQAPVSFSKQILPLFQTRCMGCHGGPAPASGYSMESRDRLLSGGRHGAAVIKGKGAQSELIRYLTGDLKPKMPPDGAVDLERISIIRRWIDEGAKIDGMIAPIPAASAALAPTSVSHSPHSPALPAPVTALSYSPDGSLSGGRWIPKQSDCWILPQAHSSRHSEALPARYRLWPGVQTGNCLRQAAECPRYPARCFYLMSARPR